MGAGRKLMFDGINPLTSAAAKLARKRAEEWFSSFDGRIEAERRDLSIAGDGEVAFAHGMHRYTGAQPDGGRVEVRVRVTSCYRRTDGKWKLTHEHASMPFDLAGGKAASAPRSAGAPRQTSAQ